MEVSGDIQAPQTNLAIHWIRGWVGSGAGLDVLEKGDTSCLYRNSNPGP